jgi:hydrogenase maturation factor
MSTVTDSDLQQLKDLIAAGQLATQKQIAELDKKMEVGFAKVDVKFAHLEGKIDQLDERINTVEAKLVGKVDKLGEHLEGKIAVIEERTKLGFWGFIFRGTALAALAALTAIFVKYLFPVLPAELPRL